MSQNAKASGYLFSLPTCSLETKSLHQGCIPRSIHSVKFEPENSVETGNDQEDQTLKNKLKVSSSEKNTTLSSSSKDQTPSSIEKSILEKINN